MFLDVPYSVGVFSPPTKGGRKCVFRVHLHRPLPVGSNANLTTLAPNSEYLTTSSQVRASLVAGFGKPTLTTNDRVGMRSDRLCPPACLRLFPTPTPGT